MSGCAIHLMVRFLATVTIATPRRPALRCVLAPQLSRHLENVDGEETDENDSGAAKHEIVGRECLASDRNPQIAREIHPAIDADQPDAKLRRSQGQKR